MITRTLHSTVFVLLAAAAAHGQSGTLDTDFGLNGLVNQFQDNSTLVGTALALRPNGNIVLAGTRSSGPNETDKQMGYMELTPDGEVLALAFFGAADRDDLVSAVAIQSDGKIILAGESSPASDPFATDIALMRIDVDGTLDESFGNGGIVISDFSQPGSPTSEAANAVSILPNGKILVAGVGDESVFEKMLVAQYLDNGVLDVVGFGTNGRTYATPGPNAAAYGMRVLSDGRMLVVGSTFSELPLLARFSSDGALDGSFGSGGFAGFNGFSGIAFSLDIQSTGNIVVGNLNQSGGGMEIFRVTSEGAFDPTFGFLGVVSTFIFPPASGATPAVVLAQPDDRLVLVGTNESGQYRALRYSPNGTPDATFGNAGSFTLPGGNSAAYCAALQPDGKLLLGGFGRVNSLRSFFVCRLLNQLTVGMGEAEAGSGGTLVYPNPVSDEATFTYTLDRSAMVTIELFDAKGAMVGNVLARSGKQSGTHVEVLDLSGLPAGTYRLCLTTGDRTVHAQFIHL